MFEMYVSAVNSHVSVVARTRFGYGVRALSSSPDQFLHISKTKVDGNMWSTSLCFPDELWRNTLSNQKSSFRELSSRSSQARSSWLVIITLKICSVHEYEQLH